MIDALAEGSRRYHECPHGRTFDNCTDCMEEEEAARQRDSNDLQKISDTIVPGGDESEVDSTMDTLIQQASIPSLATLFKKGKEAGLIKPGVEYGNKGG